MMASYHSDEDEESEGPLVEDGGTDSKVRELSEQKGEDSNKKPTGIDEQVADFLKVSGC